MKDLQIFNSNEFGQVRTLEIEGKIYFVGKDIAKALGYKNTNDAISRHCKGVVKHDLPHPQNKTKTIEMSVIPEGDLYRLVVNSELPNAEKFESWVFDEVLPTIRQTGEYKNISTKDKYISEIDIAKAELSLVEVTAKLLNLNDSSKLLLATNVYENHNIPTNLLPQYTKSEGTLLPATTLLKNNNINISTQKFNKILLKQGILEVKERKSSKGKIKTFKQLVNLEYGENFVNPQNNKEVQPLYYEDKFIDLIKLVGLL